MGDSLLDLVRQENLESYPRTNLPPGVVAVLDGPLVMRSAEYEPAWWTRTTNIPAKMREALGPETRVRIWHLQPRLARSESSRAVIVLHDGVPVEPWHPDEEPFPGFTAWYQESSNTLYALSKSPPGGVALEFPVDGRGQLARFERLLGNAPTSRTAGGSVAPPIETLLEQVELNGVSRRSLLLPAGGSLAFHFGAFTVSCGGRVADRGHRGGSRSRS